MWHCLGVLFPMAMSSRLRFLVLDRRTRPVVQEGSVYRSIASWILDQVKVPGLLLGRAAESGATHVRVTLPSSLSYTDLAHHKSPFVSFTFQSERKAKIVCAKAHQAEP